MFGGFIMKDVTINRRKFLKEATAAAAG
ncbi:MAG: twin-arginine translocation signal domain-containing protein [Planctomycetota bacterium]